MKTSWLAGTGGGFEEINTCADFKPGDDDLEAFDLIRRFKLDLSGTDFPGVTKVRGSNKVQTAYRLDRDANLQIPTK